MSESVETRTFYPSKVKWILVLLASLAFVIAGVFICLHARSRSDTDLSLSCIAFFGSGCVLAVLQLIPNSSFLRVSPEGMAMRSCWRQKLFRCEQLVK